jgi:hypothetical protein
MEADMRLIHRHRRRPRRKLAKIPITQAEITADLIYPARPKK